MCFCSMLYLVQGSTNLKVTNLNITRSLISSNRFGVSWPLYHLPSKLRAGGWCASSSVHLNVSLSVHNSLAERTSQAVKCKCKKKCKSGLLETCYTSVIFMYTQENAFRDNCTSAYELWQTFSLWGLQFLRSCQWSCSHHRCIITLGNWPCSKTLTYEFQDQPVWDQSFSLLKNQISVQISKVVRFHSLLLVPCGFQFP